MEEFLRMGSGPKDCGMFEGKGKGAGGGLGENRQVESRRHESLPGVRAAFR